jgi:hypothetical protein
MRAEVAYADARLDAWASWVRGSQNSWPPRTLLARIIDEGASGASQGTPVDNMPLQILQTDRAVARIEDRLRRTVKVYYLTHSSSEIKAAALHVSRATFWRLVERAQVAVQVQLIADETETSYSQAISQTLSL